MKSDATREIASDAPRDMRWIPGGTFLMGSDDFYPEERPVHEVAVDGFWMDEHEVTVAEYRRFVRATGYVTLAERPLGPQDYFGAPRSPATSTRLLAGGIGQSG